MADRCGEMANWFDPSTALCSASTAVTSGRAELDAGAGQIVKAVRQRELHV